jgi:hypothetical protein
LGAIAAIAALSALAPGVAAAGTITPSDGVDEFNTNAGHCSLREAIRAAQTGGSFSGCVIATNDDADTIQLQSGVTYNLSLTGTDDLNAVGDLDVVGQAGDNTLTIATTGAGRATISASGLGDRILDVAPYSLAPADYILSFTLTNIELTGGNAGVDDSGALKTGYMTSLVVGSSYIHGNTAGDGGAMRIDSGNASFTDSRIEDNTATGGFGGLWLESADPVTFSNTTIANNHALGGIGGGIAISSNTFPDVTLTNSTVYGNDASTDGGGIYSTADPAAPNPGFLKIVSSTIAGNHADFDGNGSGDGGGLYMAGAATSVARNSIFGDNTDFGGEARDCSGTVASEGYNLLESLAGCNLTNQLGEVIGVDPKLGSPVIDPGGVPVPVLPLLPGSPALNAGNPLPPSVTPPACPTTDERAFPRSIVSTGACDIGAYEYNALDTDGDKYPDDADNCPAIVNPAQTDTDVDDQGDVCDGDDDGDGVSDVDEGIAGTNPLVQDTDADGHLDGADNCGIVSNPGQGNNDGDLLGDACDADDDNDGVLDVNDGCPVQANATATGCPLPPPPAAGPTGQRAAALKKCKKKKGAARKKCKKKANKLPL